MIIKVKTLVSTFTLVSALSAGITTAMAADFTMRLTHQLPGSHHVAKAIEAFADEVRTGSDGRVAVEVFGGAQLFSPSQFHPAVARGQVEAASIVSLSWGGTIPEMQVFSIPYLITGRQQLEAFPDSDAATYLNRKFEERGVKNIGWLLDANNAVVTSSGKPLIAPEDYRGIKIRGLSRIFDTGLIAMGAAPSTMPGSEVYQGLQTRVIDAAITSVGAAYSRRYFEVQEYGVASPLITVYQNIVVNPGWWNSLPADLQEVITTAAANAGRSLIPATDEVDPDGVATLEANGVKVTVLSPEQINEIERVMRPAIVESFTQAVPDVDELISLITQL